MQIMREHTLSQHRKRFFDILVYTKRFCIFAEVIHIIIFGYATYFRHRNRKIRYKPLVRMALLLVFVREFGKN
jgi:hypothetical protein